MADRFILRDEDDQPGASTVLIDTKTGRELGSDGGEPEGNSFWRDWSWVPHELNRIAGEEYLRGLRAAQEAGEATIAKLRDEFEKRYAAGVSIEEANALLAQRLGAHEVGAAIDRLIAEAEREKP